MKNADDGIAEIEGIAGNAANLRRLVEQLRTPMRVIPFVGAGLSIPYGMPGWCPFLLKLAQGAGLETEIARHLQEERYEEAAADLLAGMGPRAFQDELCDTFGDARITGRDSPAAAALLPHLSDGPVLTTNFDHVLETVFARAGKPFRHTVWGAKADLVVQAFHQDLPFLLKLHGDVADSTDRILTLEEYDAHYGRVRDRGVDFTLILPKLLRLMLSGRPLLFLGCSLAQDRTMAVLHSVVADLPAIAHYAVVERPDDPAAFHRKARCLSEHGIRPVWYAAGRHEQVGAILQYLIAQAPLRATNPPPTGGNRPLVGAADPLLAHRSGFFGREAETTRVLAFLLGSGDPPSSAPAILIVRGAPGTGKSEICKEALHRYLQVRPGAVVYCVDVAEARNEAGLLTRLSEALSVHRAAGREEILLALAAAPGILYLDNLESVLSDRAALDLLQHLAPISAVRVLASSREILPGIAENIPVPTLDIESAVSLFLREWERAGATEPLSDTPDLRRFIAEDLDGHALSLVLLAAQAYRCPSLGHLCRAWREESMRTAALPRLEATPLTSLDVSLAHSFRTVRREARAAGKLWGLMGLFPAGLSPSAWETLFNRRGAAAARTRDLLLRLSIVTAAPDGTLHMLAPLRHFILAKAARKEDGLRRAKLAKAALPHFMGLARAAAGHSFDDRHTATLDVVLSEFANLHHFVLFSAALNKRWARHLTELGSHLNNFFQFRIIPGWEMVQAILAAQRAAGLKLATAQTLDTCGDLQSRLGNVDSAREHYREAIALYRRKRPGIGLANALAGLGNLQCRVGDIEAARPLYDEAVAIFRRKGERLGLANVLRSLADLYSRTGRIDEAVDLFGQAIDLYRRLQANLGLANATKGLGDVWLRQGRIDEAVALFHEADELYRMERFPLGTAHVLTDLGDVQSRLGHLDAALRLYHEAGELYRGERDNMGSANILKCMGDVLNRLDDPATAMERYEQALALYSGERHNLGLANVRKSMGDVQNRLGRLDSALDLYRAADELYRGEGVKLGVANVAFGIGEIHSRRGDADTALVHYREAIDLYTEERSNLGLANAYHSCGDLECARNRHDLALRHYSDARALYSGERESMGVAYTNAKLALVLHRLGQPGPSKEYLREAEQAAAASQTPMVVKYVQGVREEILAAQTHG